MYLILDSIQYFRTHKLELLQQSASFILIYSHITNSYYMNKKGSCTRLTTKETQLDYANPKLKIYKNKYTWMAHPIVKSYHWKRLNKSISTFAIK